MTALLQLVLKSSDGGVEAWRHAFIYQALAMELVCSKLGIQKKDEALPDVSELLESEVK